MLYNKARKRKGMKHMNIKAAIWDLDGTLLNTLDDLAASTNAALTENGLPTHTVDEVRMFVGNGIGKLMERAVPQGRENPLFQKAYDAFVAHYGAHSRDHTKPYDGVMELLDEYQIDPKGKECVVVGRSNIVGKPMSMLLLHRHGTVTICHSRTQDLAEVCRRADILVAAVGKAGFITPDMVKEGAVVIDVGINRNAEGKVCGDVAPEVMEKASYMTPVPGGAGPMTITMLMKNTLKAAKLQHNL